MAHDVMPTEQRRMTKRIEQRQPCIPDLDGGPGVGVKPAFAQRPAALLSSHERQR